MLLEHEQKQLRALSSRTTTDFRPGVFDEIRVNMAYTDARKQKSHSEEWPNCLILLVPRTASYYSLQGLRHTAVGNK